jgi:hypothetical protein
MHEAKGYTADVSFDGSTVVLRRKSILGMVSSRYATEHRVPVGQITAVRFQPALRGPMAGHIQFVFAGATVGGRKFDRQKDQNTAVFTRKQQPAFEAIRDAVEAASRAESDPCARKNRASSSCGVPVCFAGEVEAMPPSPASSPAPAVGRLTD